MTPDELIDAAVVALQSGDRDGAACVIAELLGTGADIGGRWAAVAKMAMAIGEVDAGVEALDRLAAGVPADEALFAQASVLAEAGRTRRAVDVAEALAARQPAPDPPTQHLLGTLKSQLGRFEEARAHFEAVLELWPLAGPSWLSLAAITDFREQPDAFRRLEAQREKMAGAAPAARAAFLYALGKAHDELGDSERAFQAFAEGARLARMERRYDPAAAEAQVAALTRSQDRAALAGLAGDPGIDTSCPIFVTGIPRSGTTLVEQMLVRHPDVGDGGEIGIVKHLVRRTGGITAAALRSHVEANGGAEAAWRGAAGLYLHLLGQRLPAEGRLVDKSLNNTRFLGLIALALPDAPLVWVRRSPLDTAWSCFRTFFIRGNGWSWDLEDIAHHIRLEEALLVHWQEVLGDRLLVIDYETLVANADGELARLLTHCRLPGQSLIGFETSDRAVATSSVAQVRRPLYATSVGAAEPYRQWLEPFTQAYEPG